MPSQIYDDLDPLYRAIWGRSLHHGYWITGKENADEARENLIQEIFKHWQPSGHVADIGCGYGTLAHRLIQEFDCTVTACTSSKIQSDLIPRSPDLIIQNGHWLEQNIIPDSLAGAIALESVSHFEDFETLSKNTHKALKLGSSWVICDWFSDHGNTFFLRHLASSGNLPPWRDLDSFLSTACLCGFTVAHTSELSHGVARTWTSLLFKALLLPLRRPNLIPQLFLQLIKYPKLLWTFPLLRFAYHKGDLSYHLIKLTKSESLSSRPEL